MRVYLDFASDHHHSLYDELINYPPEGVKYSISSGRTYSSRPYKLFNHLYNLRLFKKIKPILRNVYSLAVNIYVNRLSKEGAGADLVHVCNNFVASRERPWVLDIECIGPSTTGSDLHHFKFQKRKIEKKLASSHCKKIMLWTRAGKKSLEFFLDTERFADKIEIVYPAIHTIPIKAKRENEKLRILFIGSIYNPGAFAYKGGEYALKCFEILSRRYDIELVIRSSVPKEIKKRYQRPENLFFLEEPLPKKDLFKLYSESDISLLPSHIYPLMATLESMAFGLPVVTLDGVANSEFVEHGKTGFLARPSKHLPVENWKFFGWMREFKEKRKRIDPEVLDDLVRYLAILIEDRPKRKEMGKNARGRVEKGDFSIEMRNRKLKRIYEEAVRK